MMRGKGRYVGIAVTLIFLVLAFRQVDFEQLAAAVKLPYIAESQTDAQEGLHNRFPARLALRHRIFPTHVTGMEATLLTYNPFDLGARQAVGQDLRKRVHWQLASRHRILEALHQGYGVGAENFEQLLEGREAGDDDDELKQEVNVLDADDEEATVMNFVNQVFREGLRNRIMERMEQEGVVGQANHAGKREILIEEGASRY